MASLTARLAALLAVMVIVQHVVIRFEIFGVRPDLPLLFVVCVGIVAGPERGAIVGFAAGLLADVFLHTPVGLCALAFLCAGLFTGALSGGTDDLPWVLSALVFTGTAVAMLLAVQVGELMGAIDVDLRRTVTIVVISSLINGVGAPFAVRGVRKVLASAMSRRVVW